MKTRSACVQTGLDLGDLAYHWNLDHGGQAVQGPSYGLGASDPRMVSTHVIPADTLEGRTRTHNKQRVSF